MRSGSRYHHFIGMCQGKESCFYKAAINRSYYAIFHGISAINILDGVDASKHSSVIAYFNQFFVHTGEFNKITYKLINSAYRIRKKCDYSNFFIASREDSAVQSQSRKLSGEEKEAVKAQISDISKRLGEIRKEVRLCEGIAARSGTLKEKLKQVRADEQETRRKELMKNEHRRRCGGTDREDELRGI